MSSLRILCHQKLLPRPSLTHSYAAPSASPPCATSQSSAWNAAAVILLCSHRSTRCAACGIRHVKYEHQFLATTVVNCSVDTTESLVYEPEQAARRGRRKKGRKAGKDTPTRTSVDSAAGESMPPPPPRPPAGAGAGHDAAGAGTAGGTGGANAEDVYAPVKCNVCGTEVGVRDHHAAYHLFNVLPSHGT